MEQSHRKSSLRVIAGSVRGVRTLHFILMGILGLLVSCGSLTESILLPALLLSLSLFFAWLFTTMVNDVYDIAIDRKAHPERPLAKGEITVGQYKRIYTAAAILSMLFSTLLGLIPLLSILAFLLLAHLYSVPPFRVRDRPYATLIIGLASSLSFLAGYSAHMWFHDGAFIYIPVSSAEFLTIFLIILSALSISPLVNAYQDREADASAGARNIYAILGSERGKAMVSALIPMLFSLPLLLFHSASDIMLSISLGIFAAATFFRRGRASPVFISYFVALLYFLARMLGVL